jgi:uncharacterized membrane protein
MKQQRLDGLADGIFAIVMTLLAFDLRVPAIVGAVNDVTLWHSVVSIFPIFLSFMLSFALLFTYWRAHHFLASVYSKTLTIGLANYNAVFFFFITLVPFTSRLLGQYGSTHVAIILYGANVICIGISLFMMRYHIETSRKIETSPITKADRRSGYIRILFPVFSAFVAIVISFWDTNWSIALFTLAILFNIVPASTNIIHKTLDKMFDDDAEEYLV